MQESLTELLSFSDVAESGEYVEETLLVVEGNKTG